jgi:hypothetical protein
MPLGSYPKFEFLIHTQTCLSLDQTSPGPRHTNGNICVRGIKRTPSPPFSVTPLHISNWAHIFLILSSFHSLPLFSPSILSTRERIGAIPWMSIWFKARALQHLYQWPNSCLLLLGIPSPRWLGVVWRLPRLWLSSEKFVLTYSWEDW